LERYAYTVNDSETMSEPLDLRGLKCPLPALFARRALARAAPGAEIAVVADDPLSRLTLRRPA